MGLNLEMIGHSNINIDELILKVTRAGNHTYGNHIYQLVIKAIIARLIISGSKITAIP